MTRFDLQFPSRFVLLVVCVALSAMFSGTMPGQAHGFEKKLSAQAVYDALTQTPEWLNTQRPLTSDDLRGRILLLDFWTYSCVGCQHVTPKLLKLEQEFGSKLTILGVHSAKFTTEGKTENIREAIQRFGITYPVVNDADFRIWNSFGANAWPTLALISPDGIVRKVYKGEGDLDEIESDIKRMVKKYEDRLITSVLPVASEMDKLPATVLRFPTKLRMKDKDTLAIADSGNNRVLLVDLKSHAIKQVIGSGVKGYRDGDLDDAKFNNPQGILLRGDHIYIADTGNHRLRQVDLDKGKVTTIAGTGRRGGYMLIGKHRAMRTALASPWDMAFYPDQTKIVFSNTGTHQLWMYDLQAKTVQIVAGSGKEGIDDGHMPFNSLAQPTGMNVQGNLLFVIDAETSALRNYDGTKLKTLLGNGLFDFGMTDGKLGTALMQLPMGVYADQYNRIYISDTFNHRIRLYENDELFTLPIGGLNEPHGITKVGDQFYIADTNNHRIVIMDEEGRQTGIMDVFPPREEIQFQKDLPNGIRLPTSQVSEKGKIVFKLPKGWEINRKAPHYMVAFNPEGEIAHKYRMAGIMDGQTSVRLRPGAYHLQGMIYYCKTSRASACLMRGFTVPLNVAEQGPMELAIDLPVQE